MSELNLCKSYSDINRAEFIVDGVLFDMDGTLIDSIPAIESAWAAVALKLGRDPDEVIEETHGRRVMDNLKNLHPNLRRMSDSEMQPHVREFENEILRQADEYGAEVKSRKSSAASSRRASRHSSMVNHDPSARAKANSLSQSVLAEGVKSRMNALGMSTTAKIEKTEPTDESRKMAVEMVNDVFEEDEEDIEVDVSDLVDKSVRILPGVRDFTNALPLGRWAIATSAATTHLDGAIERVNLPRPTVTVTADHPDLKRGKPHPDPFLLAAERLGLDPKKCLVVEDSPFGIQAAVATGGKTIAVGTSHPHEKIEEFGAHWLLPTLELVQVEVLKDGRIRIFVDATKDQVEKAHKEAVPSTIPPVYVPST